jgi:hypothetical protein
MSSGQFVESGMLGRNGVIGAAAALDGPIALNTAIIQADSAGTMIDASLLKQAAKQSETIRVALVRQWRRKRSRSRRAMRFTSWKNG